MNKSIKPWAISLEGTKTSIIDSQLHKVDAPDEVKVILAAALNLLTDIPGYTDEDPSAVWSKTVPHTDADEAPPSRESLFESYWRVSSSGHPEAHGAIHIMIEPIRKKRN